MSHGHATFEVIEGLGTATACSISANHTPAPLRYVWHHILPQACGGKSTLANTVMLCDSCHYAIHALLYQLKLHGKVTPNRRNNPRRIEYAQQGYSAAVAAGTVAHIPNEGQATE